MGQASGTRGICPVTQCPAQVLRIAARVAVQIKDRALAAEAMVGPQFGARGSRKIMIYHDDSAMMPFWNHLELCAVVLCCVESATKRQRQSDTWMTTMTLERLKVPFEPSLSLSASR